VPEGANLRAEAINAGINLNQGVNGFGASVNQYMNCKGFGLCGTCRVLVTKGMENTSPLTLREKLKFKTPLPTPIPDPIPMFAYIGHEATMRLACCTQVKGDIEVESGPEVNFFGENFFS
jgi:ferredoxin